MEQSTISKTILNYYYLLPWFKGEYVERHFSERISFKRGVSEEME